MFEKPNVLANLLKFRCLNIPAIDEKFTYGGIIIPACVNLCANGCAMVPARLDILTDSGIKLPA
jgi:hypothetical protein